MHQKNIIAYRHRKKWQKLKVPFTPRETSHKNILSAVDCNVRLNSLTQRISAVEERIISFVEDATWSRECQYYTPGTSTRNPCSVQTLFWKPFGHSRTKKVAPQTPIPEWKGTGRTLKTTSVFIKYNTQITWTLQGTQPVLQSCQRWSRKMPPQGRQSYWKSWSVYHSWRKGGRKQNKTNTTQD